MKECNWNISKGTLIKRRFNDYKKKIELKCGVLGKRITKVSNKGK